MLDAFAPDTKVFPRPAGGWEVHWHDCRGRQVVRRWQATGTGSLYPVWHGKWAHGGTACMALSMLMRWLQGRPVVGMSTWRGLARPGRKLFEPGAEQTLADAGWPEKARCVLCDRELGRHDWWDLDGVSGPCCHYRDGCRQEARP